MSTCSGEFPKRRSNCVSVDLRFFSDEDQSFYQEAVVLERDQTTWAMPTQSTLTYPDDFAVGADGGAFDHPVPPVVADVVFQQHAERAVVPEAADAAVDVAGGIDEAASLGEGNDLIHDGGGRFGGHIRSFSK